MKITSVISLIIVMATLIGGSLGGNYAVVDRIEGGCAIIEVSSGKNINIALYLLPKGVKEGDCLVYANGAFQIDANKTQKRKADIGSLLGKLFY